MRNRRLRLLLIVITATLAATMVWVLRERDPVYQRKRLSQHLRQLHPEGIHIWSPVDFDPHINLSTVSGETRDAVSTVGAKALPMLVRMLEAKESRLVIWSHSLVEKQTVLSKFIGKRRDIAATMQWPALAAFYHLGPKAMPAIPKIIPLLKDPDSALVALLALRYIQPEQEQEILSLTNVLSIQRSSRIGGTPEMLHSAAILTLSKLEGKATGAVPLLIGFLASTNGQVTAAAAVALARLGADPKKVVPLIIGNLPQTNPPSPQFGGGNIQTERAFHEAYRNITMNIWALVEYGRRAQIAVPVLFKLYDYPLVNVQEAAKQAVAKIMENTNSISR